MLTKQRLFLDNGLATHAGLISLSGNSIIGPGYIVGKLAFPQENHPHFPVIGILDDRTR